jgi:hypothetical protein
MAGAPFYEILRELLFVNLAGTYFSLKRGLGPSKRGQKPPFEGKRGSRQMYDTKTSRPSFPLVSVGKIPGKYRPIPNRNTQSRCNSILFISPPGPFTELYWYTFFPSPYFCDCTHTLCQQLPFLKVWWYVFSPTWHRGSVALTHKCKSSSQWKLRKTNRHH